jgi:hypothetical protein
MQVTQSSPLFMSATVKTPLRLLLVAGLGLLGLAAAEPAAPKAGVEALDWLAGAWAFERNGRTTTEQWMAPAGGTMLGMSRTVANGRTLEHEFILLREDANRDVFYVAKPSGQAEAAFKLVRVSAGRAEFENPRHDFPQKITYALTADGVLLATIEGTRNGQARRVEFPYRRVK